MTLDERLEALTMNLELAHRDILELQAHGERHDREMAQIRDMLRRAVAASVREAPQERAKRREVAKEVSELRAAQARTDEALRRFLDSRTHTNGNPSEPPSP